MSKSTEINQSVTPNHHLKSNNVVQRKDIASQTIMPIARLYRFSKYQGEIKFDPEMNLPGRGTYVAKDEASLTLLFKKRLLNRAFKSNIDIETYNRLEQEVKSYGEKKQ